MLKHALIERSTILLVSLAILAVAIGGLVQIVPLFTVESTIEKVEGVRPYTPLEQMGRNIYVREGCYNCHSQMIRPFKDEVQRYGHYSLAAESMYDHPFQWSSKRTGPDLARIGGKYSNDWHVAHLIDPRSVLPNSIMPGYYFLADRELDYSDIEDHLKTLRIVGVPYDEGMITQATADLEAQAKGGESDTAGLLARYPKAVIGDFDGDPERITDMDALIAYLQVLGTLVDFSKYGVEDLATR